MCMIYTLAAACNGNTHPDRTVCIKHATRKAKNDMSGRIRKATILQKKTNYYAAAHFN